MASSNKFLAKQSYSFPTTSASETHFSTESTEDVMEFDEADVWNFSSSNANPGREAKKALSGSRSALKRASRKVDAGCRVNPVASASLPVNIPDWSKILKDDYKEHPKRESDHEEVDDEEDEVANGGGIRMPPHEYLARTRAASLSVHEGIGRTLKGRDLRSVRNAIWKKVGFED